MNGDHPALFAPTLSTSNHCFIAKNQFGDGVYQVLVPIIEEYKGLVLHEHIGHREWFAISHKMSGYAVLKEFDRTGSDDYDWTEQLARTFLHELADAFDWEVTSEELRPYKKKMTRVIEQMLKRHDPSFRG